MGCERDCKSCGCGSDQEAEWQRNEKAEQLEHERSLMQLLFWSAAILPIAPLFFGIWCFLVGTGVLSESPVLGSSGIILLFAVWSFLIMRWIFWAGGARPRFFVCVDWSRLQSGRQYKIKSPAGSVGVFSYTLMLLCVIRFVVIYFVFDNEPCLRMDFFDFLSCG